MATASGGYRVGTFPLSNIQSAGDWPPLPPPAWSVSFIPALGTQPAVPFLPLLRFTSTWVCSCRPEWWWGMPLEGPVKYETWAGFTSGRGKNDEEHLKIIFYRKSFKMDSLFHFTLSEVFPKKEGKFFCFYFFGLPIVNACHICFFSFLYLIHIHLCTHTFWWHRLEVQTSTLDSRPLILHYWWCHYRTWEHEHAFSDRVQQTIPFSYCQLFETEFSIAVFSLDKIQSRFKHYVSFYFSFSIQHPPPSKISHETGLSRVLAVVTTNPGGLHVNMVGKITARWHWRLGTDSTKLTTGHARGQQTSPWQRYVFTFVIIKGN